MKKFRLNFTRETPLEIASNFGLLAIGSIIGIIIAERYGFGLVFLISLIVASACFLLLFPVALKIKKKKTKPGTTHP